MKWKSYPAYKSSGVEWLGDVPVDWNYRRLRFTASEPLMYGANEAAVSDDHSLPRYIRITDVKSDGSLHEDTFRSLEEELAAPYLLQEGDILLARSGATVGKSFQYSASWGKAAYAGYLIRYRPDKKVIFPRFAAYYFQTKFYWACIQSTLIQSTIENFSAEKYKDLYIPLPEEAEQQKIADFLDWKTGQIDVLISKKKQLIEKLKEKRVALITQAVTKGLNPNAPMSDTGIPWLGEVPEHWEVVRFSFFVSFQEGPGIMAVDFRDEGIPLLRIRNVQNKIINTEGCNFLDPEMVKHRWEKYKCKIGDLVISCSASTGLVSEVDNDSEGTIVYTGLIRLWPQRKTILKEFIQWLVSSDLFFWQIKLLQTGSTMQHFGPEHLNKMKITLPSLDEQKNIVAHLEKLTTRIDSLIDKNEQLIEKLTEYRIALITSATTGKFDVRNVKIGKRQESINSLLLEEIENTHVETIG